MYFGFQLIEKEINNLPNRSKYFVKGLSLWVCFFTFQISDFGHHLTTNFPLSYVGNTLAPSAVRQYRMSFSKPKPISR